MIITNYSMFQCILIDISVCLLSRENWIFGFSVRDFSTNSVSLTRSKQGFTLNNRYDYVAPRNYAIILSRFQIHESLKLVPITIEYFLLGSRTITFSFFMHSLLTVYWKEFYLPFVAISKQYRDVDIITSFTKAKSNVFS